MWTFTSSKKRGNVRTQRGGIPPGVRGLGDMYFDHAFGSYRIPKEFADRLLWEYTPLPWGGFHLIGLARGDSENRAFFEWLHNKIAEHGWGDTRQLGLWLSGSATLREKGHY